MARATAVRREGRRVVTTRKVPYWKPYDPNAAPEGSTTSEGDDAPVEDERGRSETRQVSPQDVPSLDPEQPDAIAIEEEVLQANFRALQSPSPEPRKRGPMRLVAYTRLSRANDREQESHQGQAERIHTWAEKHGHTVVAHWRDTTSGENGLEEREGLAAALDALRDGDADGLVFAQLDRLSRDLVVQESVLREVWRDGFEAFSAAEGEANLRDDPEDPSRRLIRVVLGAVMEYERAMTALRMARGRRRAIKRGRLIGPAPTFGWVRDEDDRGKPMPDPETFPIVEEAVRRKHSGESLRKIATWLEEATGRRWHAAQVARLCERHDRYAGAKT